MQPRQSTTSASPSGAGSPTAARRSPSTSTSPTKGSRPGVMGTTHPPRSTVRSAIRASPSPSVPPPRRGALTRSPVHSTVGVGRRQDVSTAVPGTASAGARAMTSTLVGVQGHLAGQLFLITDQPLTLGRGSTNDVVLEDVGRLPCPRGAPAQPGRRRREGPRQRERDVRQRQAGDLAPGPLRGHDHDRRRGVPLRGGRQGDGPHPEVPRTAAARSRPTPHRSSA